ncbi:MAG: hypothetical protein ACLP50_24860 [Solirubrobacteraceae bacterium]
MEYTSARLARLTHADAAHELSERLVSLTSTYADGHGHGAFLTEETAGVLSGAHELLAAAVVADRLRGASWSDVGESLGITKQSAHERFAEAEREFRDALLFPHRQPEHGLGYTVAPYAVVEPDRVRERLDAWVIEHQRSSGPNRDEPSPVTRGLQAMRDTWTIDRTGQVLELATALIDDRLPAGVTHEQAERRLAELKVELYEAMHAKNPEDRQVALQLMDARENLITRTQAAPQHGPER